MSYGEFAYFYDAFNSEADYDALFNYVQNTLHSHKIKKGIIADLGCGTGELTLMLAQCGYDMIGIDASEEMLMVLRDKAQDLEIFENLLLLKQDLCALNLYGTINAAVSTFDTFNHIKDFDSAIKNAAFFMEEGGVFLFDMNTPYKHETILANNEFLLEAEDASCQWKNHYDAKKGIITISLQINDSETGETITESFCEYTHSLTEIKQTLEKYGFELESVVDGETFETLHEKSQRFLFCAVKQYTQLEDTKRF